MTIKIENKWVPLIITRLTGFMVVYLLSSLNLSVQIERLPEEIEAKIRTYRIIPDLLEESPNETIAVKYIGGFSLDLGEELVPKDLKEEPHHIRFPAEDDYHYSLLFIDIDVPSRKNPNERSYLQWLKVNINGSEARDCKIHGEEIAEYVAPNPQNGTGFHRFIYLAYRHPKGKALAFDEPFLHKTPENDPRRSHFSAHHFARKYNLGKPIALNFFIAEWKPYYDDDEKLEEGI